MRQIRKPTFTFSDSSETGIDEIPEGSLVLVQDIKKTFVMDDNTGLDGTSTVQDAIDNDKIKILSGTGLNKITESGNTGWRLEGKDPTNYGDIGSGAVDLSDGHYATHGATGDNSFACGNQSTASGSSSFAGGNHSISSGGNSVSFGLNSEATGTGSFVVGDYAHAEGDNSVAMGTGTKATGDHQIALGQYNIGGSMFEVGTGADDGNRKNVFDIGSTGISRVTGSLPALNLFNDDGSTSSNWSDNNIYHQGYFNGTDLKSYIDLGDEVLTMGLATDLNHKQEFMRMENDRLSIDQTFDNGTYSYGGIYIKKGSDYNSAWISQTDTASGDNITGLIVLNPNGGPNNRLLMKSDKSVTLPDVSRSDITDPKALTTKEFLDSKFNYGSQEWDDIVNTTPVISGAGVMEVGKYIDFHDTDSTNDYDVRLTVDGSQILTDGMTPSSNSSLVTKKYVDDNSGASSASYYWETLWTGDSSDVDVSVTETDCTTGIFRIKHNSLFSEIISSGDGNQYWNEYNVYINMYTPSSSDSCANAGELLWYKSSKSITVNFVKDGGNSEVELGNSRTDVKKYNIDQKNSCTNAYYENDFQKLEILRISVS